MHKVANKMLIALFTLILCGLGSFFGLAHHHHEGHDAEAVCYDLDSEHNEEKAPCSDDCDIDALEIDAISPKLASSPVISLHSFIHATGDSPFIVQPRSHSAPHAPPIGMVSLLHSPEFTGRFLL